MSDSSSFLRSRQESLSGYLIGTDRLHRLVGLGFPTPVRFAQENSLLILKGLERLFNMKKKISLSVSDFAQPAPKTGSIDLYSGFGSDAALGLELHRQVQFERKKNFSHYEYEVGVTHQFSVEGYIFKVSGRMDGIYYGEKNKIEEIKSSFNIYELYRYLKKNQHHHPYCLQLKTYGYLHWLKTKEIPDLTLHLTSTRKRESLDFIIYLSIDEYEEWLQLRLADLAQEVKLAEKNIKRRKKAAKSFIFPFTSPRKGQVELIDTIKESIREERPALIQAPTGLGKTIGVLYPMLQEALSRGQKIIYLTPKNSQHTVAQDAVSRLQEIGANIKALTVTAKSKMCLKNEPICNSTYCEFAENHYTKVTENQLPELLAKKRNLTSHTFKKLGEQYQVCPFELQFEVIQHVDTVICDYNYVFAPRSSIGRVASNHINLESKPNLIIDEVHNLPARSMDYYSPSLSIILFENILKEAEKIPEPFRKKATTLISECIYIIEACGPKETKRACKIIPPVEKFIKHDGKLRDFLSIYLNSDIEILPEDLIMKFTFYWSEFTKALEFITLGREEFFTTYHPHPPTLKITCCDASSMLETCYDDYKNVIGFSATLKPFGYYSQLIGLQSSNLKFAEFSSPFPNQNRKILIIPQVSTKYSERERNYPRIAEVIKKITALQQGNYFAFFPSFEFMEKTLAVFMPSYPFQVLSQKRRMSKDEIDQLLIRLTEPDKAHIIFAVQGGIFSEGVDYPGKMAIGAFIVGPPLPNFDLEQEKKREYYQEHYDAGFDYAYIYPAMAKAVQAAGRVIRSETDKGVIVLLDNRFIQANYAKCMPQDWFSESQHELVSESILKEIAEFWSC